MKHRIRSAVILIQDQKILLVKHVDPSTGVEWWVPPGGGLEDQDDLILELRRAARPMKKPAW